jgi:hypothetical protein
VEGIFVLIFSCSLWGLLLALLENTFCLIKHEKRRVKNMKKLSMFCGTALLFALMAGSVGATSLWIDINDDGVADDCAGASMMVNDTMTVKVYLDASDRTADVVTVGFKFHWYGDCDIPMPQAYLKTTVPGGPWDAAFSHKTDSTWDCGVFEFVWGVPPGPAILLFSFEVTCTDVGACTITIDDIQMADTDGDCIEILDDVSCDIEQTPREECTTNADCDDGLYCNGMETCVYTEENAGQVGLCKHGVNPCPDDKLFCNGIEHCNEILDECKHSNNPCPSCTTCNEGTDSCDPLATITISPKTTTALQNETIQFSAIVSGACDTPCYTWEVMGIGSAGSIGSTIDANGLYTAGNTKGTDIVIVTDSCNGNISDSATVGVYTYPRIAGHTPSGKIIPPVESIRLDFNNPMDTNSFSEISDVVSFTGPQGPILVNGHNWPDAQTLELTFESQLTIGPYQLVLGPEILDVAGNALDQDNDLVPGEIPDDRYTASFTLANIFSGTINEDTTWKSDILIDGPVIVSSDVTLTINAGTIIKFRNNSGLRVSGALEVNGTPSYPVVFTSFKDDTVGGDSNGDGNATSPNRGDWFGIAASASGAHLEINHAIIRYAHTAVDADANSTSWRISNSIISNNNIGLSAHHRLDLAAEAINCLVANNWQTGVYFHDYFAGILRGCTIVGNGFASGWAAAGVHQVGTLIMENCIVAFNRNGFDSNAEPTLEIRKCLFYNPAGRELNFTSGFSSDVLQRNGNIIADPLFVNRLNGDFELGVGSPAIDSGSGIQVPATDILERSRYDDHGMPNVGYGYPCYVDMGAYERQKGSPSKDLAVTFVSSPNPGFVNAGESFTFEWTVANVGTLDCTGPWQDVVYLSDDPYISTDDLVLETYSHNDTLTPGESYTKTLTSTAPVTVGPKYVLVHTNSSNSVYESFKTNNVGASELVLDVDVPLLEIGIPQTGGLSTGKWRYYRFEGQSGRTVMFKLLSNVGSWKFFLRRNLPPTLSVYDVAGKALTQNEQAMRLLEPMAGTYYVGIYAQSLPGSSAEYTVSAELTELDIRGVSPGLVGNAGRATVKIEGDSFNQNANVQLIGPGGAIEGEEYYQDSVNLFATFDLASVGAVPGMYDVVVTNPDSESAVKSSAVTVTSGGLPDFKTTFSMTGLTRPGRVISLLIYYTNNSIIDIPSPILTLDSGVNDCQWQLANSDIWDMGSDFRVVALSPDGPATVLRPGQTESITISLRVPFRQLDLNVNLSSTGAVPTDGSNEIIDWNKVEDSIRPEGVDPDTWNLAFAKLQDQVGDTWGDYAETLRENADRWLAAGKRVYSVRELLRMEMNKACGLPNGIIAGRAIDADTKSSLSGVNVKIIDDNIVIAQSKTESDGTFVISNVGPGVYSISLDGYFVQGNPEINLNMDFLGLDIEALKGGEIRGTVTDPSGKVMEGVSIQIVDAVGNFFDTSTDMTGRYKIIGIAPGNWNLYAHAKGFASPAPIQFIIEGSDLHTINILFETGASISGEVTDETGTPIEGASVNAFGTGGVSSSVITDNNGLYSIPGLAPGDWVITASANGYVSSSLNTEIIETDEVVEGNNFTLTKGIPFEGIVVEEDGITPIPFVFVFLEEIDESVGVAFTDENGVFQENHLPPGEYSAIASGSGYAEAEVSFTLTNDGLVSPLIIQLSQTAGLLQRMTISQFLADDSENLAKWEKTLSLKVGGYFAARLWWEAWKNIMNFIGKSGPDGDRIPETMFYFPETNLSQEAKKITECVIPFVQRKGEVREEIRQQVEESFFNTGEVQGNGKVGHLQFYDKKKWQESKATGSWDSTWAIGTTEEGKGFYKVTGATVTSHNIVDTAEGQKEQYNLKVTVLFTFPDIYQWSTEPPAENIYDRMGYFLQQAGWATPFRTYLQIEDTYDFSIERLKDPDCPSQNQSGFT